MALISHHSKRASTTIATTTARRRFQYTLGGSSPTGCVSPLIEASFGLFNGRAPRAGTMEKCPASRQMMQLCLPCLIGTREQGRDLPWRDGRADPWGVLVSEVMLQQTPVARVEPVWREWMERWPTAASLAAASQADAVRAWGRLGYPRRAARLWECARVLVERHGGVVPVDLAETARPARRWRLHRSRDRVVRARRQGARHRHQREASVCTRVGRGGAAARRRSQRGRAGARGTHIADGPRARLRVGSRVDGARRDRLHRALAPVRCLPHRRPLCVASGRLPSVGPGKTPEPGVARHRSPGARAHPRGLAGARAADAAHGRGRRCRRISSLARSPRSLADGLVTEVGDGTYAL